MKRLARCLWRAGVVVAQVRAKPVLSHFHSHPFPTCIILHLILTNLPDGEVLRFWMGKHQADTEDAGIIEPVTLSSIPTSSFTFKVSHMVNFCVVWLRRVPRRTNTIVFNLGRSVVSMDSFLA